MTALIFLLILFGIKQLMDADILNYIHQSCHVLRDTLYEKQEVPIKACYL